MKLIYVNSNAPIGDLPYEFVAGDSMIRLSDGRMSFLFLLLGNDGVLHEKVLDSVGCKYSGIPSPYVLFDFDQVNRRIGDKMVLQILVDKFQSKVVKCLLGNLLDILLYQLDGIDISIISSIYRAEVQEQTANKLSIDDYVFPQYLSLPAKEMMTSYFHSGGRDLHIIYQRVKTSYSTDFQSALRLFKRDYPSANLYSEREKKNLAPQSGNSDFLASVLTANGYSRVVDQNNVWINSDGQQIKIEISDPKPPKKGVEGQGLKKNGKVWSKSDEKYLLTAFSYRTPYAEIANKLQRTESAIKGRLCQLGVLMFDKENGDYVPVAEKKPALPKAEIFAAVQPEELLLSIPIDKSLLMAGLTIPPKSVDRWLNHLNAPISKGSHVDVKILIDDNWYAAKIKRVDFSRYPNHPESYQLLYSSNSSLACKIREFCGVNLSRIVSQSIVGNRKKSTYGVATFYATNKKNLYKLVIKF